MAGVRHLSAIAAVQTEPPIFIRSASFNVRRAAAAAKINRRHHALRAPSRASMRRLAQVAGNKLQDGSYRCIADDDGNLQETCITNHHEFGHANCNIKATAPSSQRSDRSVAAETANEGSQQQRIRYQVALLGLMCAVVTCYAQATFCITIVEMVKQIEVTDSTLAAVAQLQPPLKLDLGDGSCPLEAKYRDFYNNFTPHSKNATTTSSGDGQFRFDWDASQQGVLLGAFAIGASPLQVFGGRLAEIYGAKWVLLVGCLGTAITNLTVPFLAHFSYRLLVANRVLMGIAQAGMEPGLICLLAAWLTPDEAGFFISMLLFAICLGMFLGSLCSGFILTLGYSWQLVYYVSGAINLLVAILWLAFAASSPSESSHISTEEFRFIVQAQRAAKTQSTLSSSSNAQSPATGTTTSSIIQTTRANNKTQPTKARLSPSLSSLSLSSSSSAAPWCNILASSSVWAFIICKVTIRWCADVLTIVLPTYLKNVLHLSIKLNTLLNSLSSALFAIFSFIIGWLVDELSESATNNNATQNNVQTLGMSKTNFRKLMQSFASFGSAATIFLMTSYDCDIVFSMSMLLVLSSCLVMGSGGELQIPFDMTSKYPGTLHGLACTLSVSGWLAPPIIGLLLGDQPNSRQRWALVWYSTGALCLIGGIVFVLFADASSRDFDIVVANRTLTRAHHKSQPPKKNKSSSSCSAQQHRQINTEAKIFLQLETKNQSKSKTETCQWSHAPLIKRQSRASAFDSSAPIKLHEIPHHQAVGSTKAVEATKATIIPAMSGPNNNDDDAGFICPNVAGCRGGVSKPTKVVTIAARRLTSVEKGREPSVGVAAVAGAPRAGTTYL